MGISSGRLLVEVFWTCLAGGRLWDRGRTQWRDYISHQVRESRLGIPHKKLEDVAVKKDIWATLRKASIWYSKGFEMHTEASSLLTEHPGHGEWVENGWMNGFSFLKSLQMLLALLKTLWKESFKSQYNKIRPLLSETLQIIFSLS